ncbi:MAG TPA: hypothetical protein VGR12_01715, partial [Solirubrobacteraceae bacterium]|nr:hypothetical protein [Solirubrobacteraceae bacterium]
MSELGDLLELLHRGGAGDRPVRAVIRSWHDPQLAQEAFVAAADAAGATLFAAVPVEDDQFVDDEIEVLHLWRAGPDRVREEVTREGRTVRLGVRRGRTWWDYREGDAVMSNEDDPDVDCDIGREHDVLFDPGRLLGSIVLSPAGRGEVGGRPALLALARQRPAPRDDDFPWILHEIGAGADEWELAVDAEHGLLLRLEARRGGRPFRRVEVVELAVGEPLDDALFRFVAPPDVPVRSVRDDVRVIRDLRLDELGRRAPFTVLVPDRLGAGWRLDTALLEGDDEPPAVHLNLLSDDGHWQVAIEQAAGATAAERPFDSL